MKTYLFVIAAYCFLALIWISVSDGKPVEDSWNRECQELRGGFELKGYK